MICVLDAWGHRLRLPRDIGPIPFMRIVCDLYDVAVGIRKEDLVKMDYHGHAPWWLR